jgi:hypothetical protein
MQPPVLRRLLVEDYQDAPPWFGRFLTVQNAFMEQTVSLFSKNVSFGDNIFARKFSTSFITRAGYATGDFGNISFSWLGQDNPFAVLVTSITRDDGTPIHTAVGTPVWGFSNNNIVISYISGLTAGVKYNIAFLAI